MNSYGNKNGFDISAFSAIFALLLALTLSALIFAFATISFKKANALSPDDFSGNDPYTVLPLNSEEIFSLYKPCYAYSDGEVTAITTEKRELIIFNDGKYVKTVTSSTPLKQVTRIGDYLLYSDNQTITSIRTDGTKDENSKKLTYLDALNEQKDLNCVFFNVTEKDGKYLLATITNGNLLVFTLTNDLTATLYEIPENGIAAEDAPVAINSGSVFYVNGGKIMRRDLGDLSTETEQADVNPSEMIADGEWVYFISERKICAFKISNDAPAVKTLAFEDAPFDLGTAAKPSGLSFKGDKLLVTDNSADGSVQEFEIKDGDLFFTGFAIGSGLTAYNRVGANPSDIQVSGDLVAVKDDYKITVIDLNGDGYDRARFNNLCVGAVPKLFALGKDTAVCYKNQKVTAIDLNTNEEITVMENLSNARALSYNSGKYYIACPDGSKTTVTTLSENDLFTDTAGAISTLTTFNSVTSVNLIATDVFGNVYCADNYAVYKNGNVLSETPVEKIATDLDGKLFAMKNGKIVRYDETLNAFTTAYSHETDDISAFGMDIISDATVFALKNKEGLFFTLSAENSALAQALPSEEFKGFSEHINDIELYEIRDNANIYSVTADGDKFVYNGLVPVSEDNSYQLIAKIYLPYDPCLYALASKKGVVLADERELTAKTADYYSAANTPDTAYISTKVCAYALPLTVKGDTFVMTASGNKIVLEKGVKLDVKEKFRLCGADFYRAAANLDGNILYCYVPADFTALALTENFETENYTIELVNKTVLYEDKTLSAALLDLDKGVTVKVYEKTDKYLKVAAENDAGETVVGYIHTNAVLTNPKNSVRNVLIVLALVASLCGTFTFIVLKKKKR